jgi:hypothetical protein
MDKPGLLEHRDIAWLILGYLSRCPDAKDTVEGVQQWWMTGLQGSTHARRVQGALDELVKAGWLLSSELRGTGIVYGLNADRRQELRLIVSPRRHGQETGSLDSRPLDD